MADSAQKRGEPDRSIISLNQDHELRYWTKELAVTESELRKAVLSVGNTPVAVRKFLGRS